MHKVKPQTSTIARKFNKRKRSNGGTTNVQGAINDPSPAQFAIIAEGSDGTSRLSRRHDADWFRTAHWLRNAVDEEEWGPQIMLGNAYVR